MSSSKAELSETKGSQFVDSFEEAMHCAPAEQFVRYMIERTTYLVEGDSRFSELEPSRKVCLVMQTVDSWLLWRLDALPEREVMRDYHGWRKSVALAVRAALQLELKEDDAVPSELPMWGVVRGGLDYDGCRFSGEPEYAPIDW